MKLLVYSSRRYLLLSSLLILLSIPVFYLVVNRLFLHSVDESLKQEASLTPKYLHNIKTKEDLELWKKVDSDLEISLYNDKTFQQKPFTVNALSDESGEVEQYRYLQKKVTIFDQIYIITFKTSLLEKEDLLKSILLVQVSLLLFLFIGSIFINRSISKKIWRPFQEILDFLKNFDLEKNIIPQEKRLNIDEFNELNTEINQLISRTQKAYFLQKEFTENASHELQTPIAVIKSKLELFLQEEQLNKNQSLMIDQINDVLNKLNDLNKNLLLLAKIDNQQFEFKELFSVKDLVDDALQNVVFFSDAKAQRLIFSCSAEKNIHGNPILFSQMLNNLLINAIQNSPSGKDISINLTEENLIMVNDGNPLKFSEDKLFRRFSKTESSKSGNGLGLAICKKIADMHHAHLFYTYSSNQHHFILEF